MMATTIMISTRVKPDLFVVLIFILACLSLARRELGQQAGYYQFGFFAVHVLPVATAPGWQ
jgi:hypothetical protein